MSHPIDHVALLVQRIEPVLERLGELAGEAGEIQEFPGEGTRELYLGGEDRGARLLLMEPLGESGPYARALAKRGPGLHHVAIHVPRLEDFLAGLRGWLVHPACLAGLEPTRSLYGSRTLWLARPGVATLLEIHEGDSPGGPPVVERLEVPAGEELETLLRLEVEGTPVGGLTASPDATCWVTLGGRRLPASTIVCRD